MINIETVVCCTIDIKISHNLFSCVTDRPSASHWKWGETQTRSDGRDAGSGELCWAHQASVGWAGGAHTGAWDRERPAQVRDRLAQTGPERWV